MTPLLLALDIRTLLSRAAVLAEQLPAERREIMDKYHFAADRHRSLAAWLLMREVANGRPILRGEFGKPYIDGGPCFNVSHSGDYAVMAVADRPIGVDIEMHQNDDYQKLAEVSFHPDERRFLAKNYGREFFYDMWTLKESYMKMSGKGFSLEPTSFSLELKDLAAHLVLPPNPNIVFALYRAIPGYSLAVCVDGGELPAALTWYHSSLRRTRRSPTC